MGLVTEKLTMTIQGIPQFNVKNFGAVGDAYYDPGIGAVRGTDDTAAIQNCYNAAANALQSSQGGSGIVYFPPSTGYYWVKNLNIPSLSAGWLTSIFDNGMYVNTVFPGNNNKFIGRTANLAGLTGSFVSDAIAEWQQPKGSTGPVVDLQGVDQAVFKGISFAGQTTGPAVKIEPGSGGQGTVFITFDSCVVLSAGDTQRTPSFMAHGAFGLHLINCSLGNLYLAMGMTTIRGGFLHSVYFQNPGAPSGGDLSIEDVLSEGLNNENFLTIDTSGGPANDFTLSRIRMADTAGSSYMIKHINDPAQSFFPVTPWPANWVANVKISMCPQGNIGAGYIDPSSAAFLLSVICEGSDANRVLEAQGALYDAMLKGPKSPLIVYGSRYLNPPIQTIQGT